MFFCLFLQTQGSLTFSYVLAADNQNNRLYRCQLTNARSNDLQLSVAYSRVTVIAGQRKHLISLFRWQACQRHPGNIFVYEHNSVGHSVTAYE